MSRLGNSKPVSHRHRSQAGFTLMEIMVAVTIGSMMLTGIAGTYIFSLKGFVALSNYTQIHAAGRRGLDRFARDIRLVSAVRSWNTNNLVVSLPTAFDSNGNITGSNTVTHSFSGTYWYRTDGNAGKTAVLADNVSGLQFTLYDGVGSNTTDTATAKEVQVNVKLQKQTVSLIQSEVILSARVQMRNIR
jgi:prepilin-type N-terminal cleavage/methylation domain-containing protein